MKTIGGIILGFAMMPAMLGLGASFVWMQIHFGLASEDIVIGAVLGGAVLVLGVLTAFKFIGA